MTLSRGLAAHSMMCLGVPPLPAGDQATVQMRRAISAAYYALFHRLSEAMVEQLAPQVPVQTGNRIHRWLDHAEIKKVCKRFAATQLQPPLRDILGVTASADMQTVAFNFIKLQEARYSADYDPDYELRWQKARELVQLAYNAIEAWERISPSAESNIFVLSLVLWKKLETARE